jgi:hypothetical protein
MPTQPPQANPTKPVEKKKKGNQDDQPKNNHKKFVYQF